MNITKVISTNITTKGKRLVKFLRFGKRDVQTSQYASPYGDDSNPIENLRAIYAPTGEKGKTIIIGYINQNAIAAVGEKRIFSTDTDGNVVFSVHLKNDGTCEIGGDADFAVRFSALKTGFDTLKSDFNTFLLHVHGAAGTPPAPPATPSTASVDGAKIDEIKVP